MNVQAQRKQRRWSQPLMARELTAQGVRGLHASSIAKIEAGDRSVRINEAVAYADVFGVPLNTLLGRASEAPEDNLTLSLRAIRDTCARTALQVYQAHKALMDLKRDIADHADDYDSDIDDITALLDQTHDKLHDVAERASQQLGSEQTPEAFR